MGFLIRTAFWLSLVLLVIPFDVSDSGEQVETVSPVQAFLAARDAVGDIAGMCERQPEVCEVGRSALHTIGLKARETARIAYAWIEEDSSAPSEPDTRIMTGSVEIQNGGEELRSDARDGS
jgi:hypothetical protein